MIPHRSKIVLTAKTVCNLDQYRNDMGELAIYLPPKTPYQIATDADELSDLERILSDYTTTFELQADHRTRIILGNVQYRIVKGVALLEAYLAVGDIVVIRGFLAVTRTSDKLTNNAVGYTLQLLGTHQTWKEVLRSNCLQNLSLGSVIWTKANLLNLMEFNDIYNGGASIYPMLADFGQFHYERYGGTPQSITIYDLRFTVYKAAIIKAAFALAGYCVKSVFLENEYFRKESIYALKSDFYALGTELGLEYLRLSAKAERSTNIQLVDSASLYSLTPHQVIPTDVTVSNINGYWNSGTLQYQNTSIRNIDNLYLRVNLTFCAPLVSNVVVQVDLVIRDAANNLVLGIPITDTLLGILAGQCLNYTELINVDQIFRDNLISLGTLDPSWRLEVMAVWLPTGAANAPILQAGSSIEYFFGGRHFYEDENINIASVLDCSRNLYEYLLDFKKEYNLNFLTDESSKTVYIEPKPEKYIQYESYTQPEKVVRGFERGQNQFDGVFDITSLIDLGQTITKNFEPQSTYNRFVFKFKESTDENPAYLPFKDLEIGLWGKDVQFGNTNTDNALEIALNHIEPTIGDFVARASFENNVDWRRIFIPLLWDNQADSDGTPPQQGVNYAPRSLHVFGWIVQSTQDPAGGATVARRWLFEGSTMIYTPTLAQALPPTLLYQDTFIPFSKVINNIFGDNAYNFWQKDLVTTFYNDSMLQTQSGIELTLDIRLTALDFKCFDVRKTVRIFSQKQPLIHLNGLYRVVRLVVGFGEARHAQITLQPILPCE